MPISSTNQRLTREIYRPPPKSLDEIRMMYSGKYNSSGSMASASRISMGSGMLNRERHLDGFSSRKTAVVGPINDANISSKPVNGEMTSKSLNATKIINAGDTKKAGWGGPVGRCCGIICTKYNIIAFLLGLLLGALITGLIVGLVLYAEIKERDAIIAALQEDNQDCFKDPCPSRSSSCGYTSNNTEIVCNCNNSTDTQPLTDAGYIDGYSCTFFNGTLNATTPVFSITT